MHIKGTGPTKHFAGSIRKPAHKALRIGLQVPPTLCHSHTHMLIHARLPVGLRVASRTFCRWLVSMRRKPISSVGLGKNTYTRAFGAALGKANRRLSDSDLASQGWEKAYIQS